MTSRIEKLKYLREKQNMSQQELADFIKVSRASVNRYENGSREVPIHVLIKIANYFGVTIDYLVGRDK